MCTHTLLKNVSVTFSPSSSGEQGWSSIFAKSFNPSPPPLGKNGVKSVCFRTSLSWKERVGGFFLFPLFSEIYRVFFTGNLGQWAEEAREYCRRPPSAPINTIASSLLLPPPFLPSAKLNFRARSALISLSSFFLGKLG